MQEKHSAMIASTLAPATPEPLPGSPCPSSLRSDRVLLHCRCCDKTTALGPLLSYLSNVRLSKGGTTLIRVDSQGHRAKNPASVDSKDEPCLFTFHSYLQALNNNNCLTGLSKTKKIKKRGRKKWVARHDLILEGCILLWGEDIDRIMRLLPEFNENVIRRKLGHVLWRDYSLTAARQPKPTELVLNSPPETTQRRDNVSLLGRFNTIQTIQEPEMEDWDMGQVEPQGEAPPIDCEASPKKADCDLEHDTIGTALGSEVQNDYGFDRPMLYRERRGSNSTDLAQNESDPIKGASLSRFNIGEPWPMAASFADLSRLLTEGTACPKDYMPIQEHRRDQMLYQNSLADIFGYERGME